jgi:hypothetical protein
MLMLAQARQLLLGLVRSVQARGEIRFEARGTPRQQSGGTAEPRPPDPKE